MVVTNQGFFSISGWDEYQNIEGMDKIREQNRLRKQRQRESQRLLPDVSRDSHVTVTLCHATEEEKEKEIEIELDINNIGDSDESQPVKKRKQFKPPTVEEVRDYCYERNNNVNAEAFVDFYESKGWMVGKNKMKDWKAAVRTWEKGNNSRSYTTKEETIKNRVSMVDDW